MFNGVITRSVAIFMISQTILAGCQMVPEEKDEHIFVQMQPNGSYMYDGQSYNAERLSVEIKERFLAGKIPSRKLEIHCLKYLKFVQMADIDLFSKNNIKIVNSSDFRFKSECTGNDIIWTFNKKTKN